MSVIKRTKHFQDWFLKETEKSQVQIEQRLFNIKHHDYFGTVKPLDEDIAELKWKNGRRIYFANIEGEIVLLLLGGNKNGQNKDIKKARKIFKDHLEEV